MPKVGGAKKAGGGPAVGGGKPAKGGGPAIAPAQPVASPPPEHAGEIYNPGVENPVVAPFLTQQDIEEYAESREQYEEGLKELDRNYETMKHSNEYEGAEIEKGRIGGKDAANWDMAGRGLFRSSIRDADLADIDATAEIKKKFLSDQLSALAVYNEGQKKSQEARWHRYEEAMHRKEVENAEGVSATMPKYQVEPGWEKAPQAKPPPAAKPPKNQGPKFKPNDPIGGGNKGGGQKSKNGGITAPPPNPSVSNAQKIAPKAAKQVASGHIAGKLYG